MAGTAFRHGIRTVWLVAGLAAVAVAAPIAQAQPCSGPLPTPGAAVPGGDKFRLIAQQCSVLSEPATVQRAAQLELYQRPGTASVSIGGDAGAPPTPEAPPHPGAADRTPPTRDAARILSLAPSLIEAARLHQVDPLLLHSIAHVESRHNAAAVSRAGARGVMQVMPATGRRFGVTDPERNLHDADTNLRASAAYLRLLQRRFGDDLRLVLAAYNAGEGAVEKYGHDVPPYAETQDYVRKVLSVYRRLAAEFSVSESGALVARGGRS